ncbi:MAG: DUF4358 domain-containing protein [Firmicutes bacterium]|nr:DUF4358 domain-containing protein [Bacillota bacterium]
MKIKFPTKSKKEKTEQTAAKKTKVSSRKLGDILFLLIKCLLLILLVGYVALLFLQNTTKDVSIETIEKTMEKIPAITELTQGDENTLRQMFSLDASACDNAIIYTSESLMDVSELLIVKVSDPSQISSLEEVVYKHLENQKTTFDGYGTDQYDLLCDAIVLSKGDYFFYGVSEDIDKWEEAFLSCIK